MWLKEFDEKTMHLYMCVEIGGYILSMDVNIFYRLNHSVKYFCQIPYSDITYI